jgi:hypothetical protein
VSTTRREGRRRRAGGVRSAGDGRAPAHGANGGLLSPSGIPSTTGSHPGPGLRAAGQPDWAEQLLTQLCGEVLRREPPRGQPPIIRSGAAAGLELFDLLLNPDHVIRATEELVLRSAVVLDRRFSIDISFDRLSRQTEDGAMLLTALVGGRLSPFSPDRQDQRLWIPLATVRRPVAVPVDVTDGDGTRLVRPAQRGVRTALEAALYHVLRESLRVNGDFDVDGSAVNTLMRRDHPARWLLQSALVALCEEGPESPRGVEREAEVERRAGAPAGDIGATLDELLAAERNRSRQAALQVTRDVLSAQRSFLELLDLVHRNYVIVAGLDRRVRDHTVHFDMPHVDALEESVGRNAFVRYRRTTDAREHNYTVKVHVPIPRNVREYALQVSAPADGSSDLRSEMSVIAAISYSDHPGDRAIDTILACVDELARQAGEAGDGHTPGAADRKFRFVADRAMGALAQLDEVVTDQDRAGRALRAQWQSVPDRALEPSLGRLRAVTATARERIATARRGLAASGGFGEGGAASRAAAAYAALVSVVVVMQDPVLSVRLVGGVVPGQEVARLRVNRPKDERRPAPRPQSLDVWATVSDESRPYARSALLPPVGLAALVYAIGTLLFNALGWPVRVRDLAASVAHASPDAIVAVLLLIPGFALTQLRTPHPTSVPGMLGRPSRVFVVAAIGILCFTAVVVAGEVGNVTGSADPWLVLFAFRLAFGVFATWSVWAGLAWALRGRYVLRPKGLRDLFDPWPTRGRGPIGYFAYDRKDPDALFDLTRPNRSSVPRRAQG